MTSWRYIAQRALTGEFLDLDLPLQRDETTWTLSGAGALRGTVTPDVGRLRADDGSLLLEEWGTLLYAEADGLIRWGGIVVSSQFDDAAWAVEAAGFATYPHGLPYVGDWSRVQVDPADAFREVWRHLQAQPGGNLGVVVSDTRTPVRRGTPSVPAYTEVKIDGTWKRKDSVPASAVEPSASALLSGSMTKTSTSFKINKADKFGSLKVPFDVKIGSETITVGKVSGTTLSSLTRGVGASSPAAHSSGTKVTHTGTETREVAQVDAEPYRLAWYETTDCGSELQTLATETPFDFVESHRWDGDVIRHDVTIGYPRLGTRRDDLAFVQGDNVIETVTPTLDGDVFANEVVGIGKGEGASALRRTTAVRDSRLRRAAVYTAKDVGNAARLDALIARELTRSRQLLSIESITVRDHPNAPIGSWSLGDDILVRAAIPWLGEVALWCRVISWSLLTDDTASLSLARSDSFTYGGSA